MSDHEHHESHSATYFAVFIALCVFTAISVVADVVHLPKSLLFPIVLSVATAKALCVMMWFMHLKFERAWKYLLLAPTLILASAVPFSLYPDIGNHYYVQDVPQIHEYRSMQAAGTAGGHGDGAHGDPHAKPAAGHH